VRPVLTEDETTMKIHVNRVPTEGVHEETTYDPKVLDVGRFDVEVAEPIQMASYITKAADELIVQATIHGRLELSCARCLQTFELPLDTSVILSYEVHPTDVVDITEDVRQEIMLAYPMIPLCREDCKGLCAICGQNLNVGSCPHQETP